MNQGGQGGERPLAEEGVREGCRGATHEARSGPAHAPIIEHDVQPTHLNQCIPSVHARATQLERVELRERADGGGRRGRRGEGVVVLVRVNLGVSRLSEGQDVVAHWTDDEKRRRRRRISLWKAGGEEDGVSRGTASTTHSAWTARQTPRPSACQSLQCPTSSPSAPWVLLRVQGWQVECRVRMRPPCPCPSCSS